MDKDKKHRLIKTLCPFFCLVATAWSAADACDNSISASQVIQVKDDEAPVITGCPADLAAIDICTTPVPAIPMLTVTDNCDDDFQVTGSCCFDGAGLTRTWTATDECGNSAIPCDQQVPFSNVCGGV